MTPLPLCDVATQWLYEGVYAVVIWLCFLTFPFLYQSVLDRLTIGLDYELLSY